MLAGIYLHIPFCKSRCSYCDFATDVYKNAETVERYVNALCKEISNFKFQIPDRDTNRNAIVNERATGNRNLNSEADNRIDTIYFGGGTPSLLTPNELEKILNAVHRKFSVQSNIELTMEMNPATVTLETLQDYKSLGVNRASFGVQTFDDIELKRLARGHNADDAHETFRLLREAGFENISFDLIAGLPRQTLADWERNLDEAIKLRPEHLSLYLLEIHEGTPLAEQIRSERQPLPDEEFAAEMYEMMLEKISASGYGQYEISNFSLPGFESKHNSKYWRLDPVFGFGVSAHSFNGLQRYANERDTFRYVKMIEQNVEVEVMREETDTASDFIFLGLRLNNGINLQDYQYRFQVDIEDKYRDDLNRLKEAELLKISNGSLKLTQKGMLFSNEVFSVFV